MLRFGEIDPFTRIVEEETTEQHDNGTMAVNRRVRDRLAALAEQGERWAAMILDESELKGLGDSISGVLKQQNRTTIRLPFAPDVVEMPSVYGTRRRNADTGKKTNEWQRSRWKQEPLEIALEVSRDLIREGGRQVERGEAIAAIVGFIKKLCPEASSIEHGCAMLNLDPDRLNIDEDATGTEG